MSKSPDGIQPSETLDVKHLRYAFSGDDLHDEMGSKSRYVVQHERSPMTGAAPLIIDVFHTYCSLSHTFYICDQAPLCDSYPHTASPTQSWADTDTLPMDMDTIISHPGTTTQAQTSGTAEKAVKIWRHLETPVVSWRST